MMPFPSFQGSRTVLFSGLSAGDSYPLRIPFDRLGAAVSPTSKPRKDNVLPPVTPEKVSFLPFSVEFFKDLNCGIISFTFQRPSDTGKGKAFWSKRRGCMPDRSTRGKTGKREIQEKGSLEYALDMLNHRDHLCRWMDSK